MERICYLDTVKGLLIFLVVLGHFLQVNNISRIEIATIDWIYCFHMPLFALLSGYFSHPYNKNYLHSILRVFETFLVFQIIRTMVGYGWAIDSFFYPRTALWYLLSLAYWRCFLYILPDSKRENILFVMALSFILSLCAGFIPQTTFLSFQRTFVFLPFFMGGYLLQNHNIKSSFFTISNNPFWCLLMLICVWVVFFIIGHNYLLQFSGTNHYFPHEEIYGVLGRILTTMLAFFMILLFCATIKSNNLIASLGRKSMFIYIYHIIIWEWFIKPLILKGLLSDRFVLLIIYAFVTTTILYIMERFYALAFIINPITNSIMLCRKKQS